MMVANHNMEERVYIDYEIDQAPISFSYTLCERVRCTMRQGIGPPTVAERVPGDGVLAYLPQTKGTVYIYPNRRVVGISLHFSVHAFKTLFPVLPRCLEHLDTGHGDQSKTKPVYHQSRFGADTFRVLTQILQCPYTGNIRKIFLEAKTLELVALKMGEWEQNGGLASSELKRRDIDRIPHDPARSSAQYGRSKPHRGAQPQQTQSRFQGPVWRYRFQPAAEREAFQGPLTAQPFRPQPVGDLTRRGIQQSSQFHHRFPQALRYNPQSSPPGRGRQSMQPGISFMTLCILHKKK
jgi:hypothetical protein